MLIVLGIIVGFFVLLTVMRLLLMAKMKKMKGQDAPSLPGKQGAAVASGNKSLFYFYAPSCGACRSMTPVVGEMAKKSNNVFSVDISSDYETARKFGVMATPTTIIVEKG
ncbi:thioredoxin family protein, partial [Myxococcota bacterium]|nr:thioredoxin family protein [Myxococcota bacterium]MBU1536342.1 thioredoxin family protein [Myxococcota bacterium]